MLKKSRWKPIAAASLMCIMLFLASSCSSLDSEEPDIDYEGRDEWYSPAITGCEEYQNLNLDGIGNQDDKLIVFGLLWDDYLTEWDNYEAGITVLVVSLGTGERISAIVPAFGDYNVMIDSIFSPQKESVVLEVKIPYSNYGAAQVYAFEICGADSQNPFPYILIRLDTDKVSEENEKNGIYKGHVTDGTEVVRIDGISTKGIRIFSSGPNGDWREESELIYWDGTKWIQSSE